MQTPSNDPSDQNLFLTNRPMRHLLGKWRIGLLISVLVIGVLLYHSFPLSIWLVVVHVLLKEAPAPEHFLLLLVFSFIVFLSWILLLFIALQVLLPIRIRDHSQEESLASPPLVSRKTMGTAGSNQLKSSPAHHVKRHYQAPLDICHQPWLYQDSSRGNASPVMFQIHPANLRGTNQNRITINGWSLCHPGLQRRQEPLEDYLLVAGELRLQITPPVPFTLFILADGHVVSSEDAQTVPNVSLSRLSAHWLSEILLPALCSSDPLEPQTVLHLLTEGMQQANRHLYQEYQREQTSQIVTMTALLIVGMQAYMANVGDNRAYVYRPKSHRQATDEGLFQITTDHSSISTQLERGVLTPKDLFQLPKEDHIYRALGQHARLSTVDVFSMTLSAGDFLVLCSDGLWKTVREATFLHIIEHLLEPPISSPALLCPTLVQAALEAGGYDHTSIMLAQVLLA
jgi:protein phosphatase